MKKIKLIESDLQKILNKILLEQEERIVTFTPEQFITLILSNNKKFVDVLNKKYDKVVVNGSLDLDGVKIYLLPNNLIIEGSLHLYGTLIEELPKNLRIKGNLWMGFTSISSIPNDLKIGYGIYAGYSKIKNLPSTIKKVKGSLDLTNTEIQFLPDNFNVDGDLTLEETSIKFLPDNLKVFGDLNIGFTEISSLPENLEVSGTILLGKTPLSENKNLIDFYIKKGFNIRVNGIVKEFSEGTHSIKEALSKQETERVWNITGSEYSRIFLNIFNGNAEKFSKFCNEKYDKIIVNSSLFLNRINIQPLPDNLYINGGLYLIGSNIEFLPKNLKAVEGVYIWGTPLSKKRKLIRQYREKNYNILHENKNK